MSHPGWQATRVSVVVMVALLTACTSQSIDDEAPQTSTSPPRTSVTKPSGASSATAALRCQRTPGAVLDRAKLAIAPHPGPVRETAVVRAAETDTGTWYVIGVDRAHVLDNGTPTGSASRSLGLTNAIDTDVGASMILIGEGTVRGNLRMFWDDVSWTGETLRAGQRAARRAVECLDAATG